MDPQTSLGQASLAQRCRALGLSRQALHAASKPWPERTPRTPRQGPWLPDCRGAGLVSQRGFGRTLPALTVTPLSWGLPMMPAERSHKCVQG